MDKLSGQYLNSSFDGRLKIRSAFKNKNGLLSALIGYAYISADKLRKTADKKWLNAGLASVSIENCRRDYRDMLLALAELYIVAEDVGKKTLEEFTKVSKLSSNEKLGSGDHSVQQIPANFKKYGVLKERRSK